MNEQFNSGVVKALELDSIALKLIKGDYAIDEVSVSRDEYNITRINADVYVGNGTWVHFRKESY